VNLFKKLLVPALFIVLLLFGFLLRSKMLLNGDFYYLLDQSRDMLLAQSIVIDHKLTLIGARTGLGGLFHGALWIYMITPFFMLAKGNPFFTLTPLFELVNLGIIAVGFFVGKQLYGKWMGLLFGLLLTISSTLVETVPFTSNAQVLPSIVLLYLYSIIKFMRGEEKYFIFALLFIGLGFQFESAFAILLVPLTLLAILLRKKLPTLKNTLWGIGAFFLAVSTFILFDLRHQFLMTSSAFKLFTNHVKPLPGYEQYADIGFRVQDRIMNLWGSLFTPLFAKDSLTSWLLVAVIALGVFFLFKNIVHAKKIKKQEREYLFILLAPVVVYGIYIFYPLPLWPHYLLPISALAVFVLSLSIQVIWTKPALKLLVGIFLVLAILPALLSVKNSYVNAPQYVATSDGSYSNQLEVATWVLRDTKNQEYGYFVYTTGILTYNMDYLLSWLSKKDNLILPSNQKHPTTYLIMYPHSANDKDAYIYWKNHVVRTTGKVVLTKTFDSGIIVEKLQIPANEQPADPNYYQNLIFR